MIKVKNKTYVIKDSSSIGGHSRWGDVSKAIFDGVQSKEKLNIVKKLEV